MSGKVELTIERYEELTEIERNLKAKEKELETLKEKARDEGEVLVCERLAYGVFPFNSSYEYKGKDEVIAELVESLKTCDSEKRALKKDLKEYTDACFSDRLCYLFLGRLPGKE